MTTIELRSPNLKSIRVGKLEAKYNSNGTRILRYFIDFWHNELDLHKELSAPEIYLLQGKIDELLAAWDKKLADHHRKSKIVAGKDVADQMTVDAAAKLASITGILRHTLNVDDRVNWEAIKDNSPYGEQRDFLEPQPKRETAPKPLYFSPHLTFWDTLLSRRKRKLAQAAKLFEEDKLKWNEGEKRRLALFDESLAKWTARKVVFDHEYSARKGAYLEMQAIANNQIDALARGVATGDAQSVIEHSTLVLEKSDYGDLFEQSFEIEYVRSDKTILVEYELPSPDQMPILKSAKFISSSGELQEIYISDREQKMNFDSACYQICLRTIHELFEADEDENITQVLFNGFSTYIDKSTGKDTRSCIMSVMVSRKDFMAIDLSRIEPKACFKSLKGVSASTLSALAPIPPVMELNREDRRFIEGRNTADKLSDATNLASMDWGDFEHLVRELFEKEFASRGGEVRVTQSSSDGGVDAVAFDPDPITGGKIVIQAKRYTRTVGVAAVRDLYGTMQHEGASRGVLITTADYGPDAYKFSSGKPITLFTGANLLHLLGKHGYHAKIDLKEARQELNLRDYHA